MWNDRFRLIKLRGDILEILDLLDESCIYTSQQFDNKTEALKFLSSNLYEKGYVKESYFENILMREEKFPTGLKNSQHNIAIPHTEAEFVNRSCVSIVTLKEPVGFKRMDDPDAEVMVDIIFMLAVATQESHSQVLSTFVKLAQNKEFLSFIKDESDSKKIVNKIKKLIGGKKDE